MSRFLAAALALTACFSAPALAENATGSVTVEPGLWAWTHETIIGQMPINESSTQCIHPGQNQMSLKEMAEEHTADGDAKLAEGSGRERGLGPPRSSHHRAHHRCELHGKLKKGGD